MNYSEYLYNLHRYGIKFGLENIYLLMKILDNPHDTFKSIHIAGTNGKGSTAAMLSSILKASGYRVGLYTSPHLVNFTERIKINGIPISEHNVEKLTEYLKSQISNLKSQMAPTYFEFTTAIAFRYFADEDVDIAVIECGMGGRLDATNVITPSVCIITHIDYDHQAFLGDSIREIAFEKAGIIKEGIPVITSVNHQDAIDVLTNTCINKGSRLYLYGKDFYSSIERADINGTYFNYEGIKSYRNLCLPLLGEFQAINASLAIAATEILIEQGYSISEDKIKRGLSETVWEGRLQIIGRDPTVILDGAHNPSAAKILKDVLVKTFLSEGKRLIIILGIMGDKDIEGIISTLTPDAEMVIVTRPGADPDCSNYMGYPYERSANPYDLMRKVKRYNQKVIVSETVSSALSIALKSAKMDDIICVTGSLYTVGEVLELKNKRRKALSS